MCVYGVVGMCVCGVGMCVCVCGGEDELMRVCVKLTNELTHVCVGEGG